MNDFGEMSSTGAVLSDAEIKDARLKRGECETCGQQCFKKSLFKQTPLTIEGRVLNGKCLVCQPIHTGGTEDTQDAENHGSTRNLGGDISSSSRRASFPPREPGTEMRNKDAMSRSMSTRADFSGSGTTLNSSIHKTKLPTLNESGQKVTTQMSARFGRRNSLHASQTFGTPDTSPKSEVTSQSSKRGGFFSKGSNRYGSQTSLNSLGKSDSLGMSEHNNEMEDILEKLEDNITVEDILDIAADYSESRAIQKKAMYQLVNAKQNMSRYDMERLNRIIIDAMVRFNGNFSVMELACACIIKFAAHDSFKTAIVANGGAEQLIVSISVSFTDNVEFIKMCFSTFRVLCAAHNENKVLLVEKGAIDSVVSMMQLYKSDYVIQEYGASTLNELGCIPETAQIVGESGGISMLVRALWTHAKDKHVAAECCLALEVLSSNFQNLSLMVEVGAIPALINAMQAGPMICTVQGSCCAILANLAATSKEVKTKIVEAEALDAVAMAMVVHKDVGALQRNACSLLINLICAGNIDAIQAAKVPELMKEAARNFPSECDAAATTMIEILSSITEQSQSHMSAPSLPSPKSMSIRGIKDELKSMNISFTDCFDKESLCTRLEDARSGTVKNSSSNNRSVASSSGLSSSTASSNSHKNGNIRESGTSRTTSNPTSTTTSGRQESSKSGLSSSSSYSHKKDNVEESRTTNPPESVQKTTSSSSRSEAKAPELSSPKSMSIRGIKDELKSMNISFTDCFDKESLCTRLEDARSGVVKGEQGSNTSSSSASNKESLKNGSVASSSGLPSPSASSNSHKNGNIRESGTSSTTSISDVNTSNGKEESSKSGLSSSSSYSHKKDNVEESRTTNPPESVQKTTSSSSSPVTEATILPEPASMKIRQIKDELDSMNISFTDCRDKESLCSKLIDGRRVVAKEKKVEELRSLQVKQLRIECAQNNIRWAHMIEKEEYVQALIKHYEQASLF